MDTNEIIEAINALEPITRTQLIISVITAVLGSSVINGVVTHMLYNRKLKKDQAMRGQGMIWDKIAEALEKARDIELKSCIHEIYQLEDRVKGTDYLKFFGTETYYLAIMNDPYTFHSFLTEVNDLRNNYGKYLDPSVDAYLYYMQNYTFQLMDYLNKNNITDYRYAGTLFIFDILKWQQSFEKLLVKRINNPKRKVYIEHNAKWKRITKKLDKKLWRKSYLYTLVENVDNLNHDVAIAMLFGIDDEKIPDLNARSDKEARKFRIKVRNYLKNWID